MEEKYKYTVYCKEDGAITEAMEHAKVYFDRLKVLPLDELLKMGDDVKIKGDMVLSLWELNDKDDENLCVELMQKTLDYLNGFNYYKFNNGLADYIHFQMYQVLLYMRRIADCETYISEHQQWIQDCANAIDKHFLDENNCNRGLYLDELFE